MSDPPKSPKSPRKYLNTPPIALITNEVELRGYAKTLKGTIEGKAGHLDISEHLSIVNRIIDAPAKLALVCDTGNPCGILTYREAFGYAFMQEIVVQPDLKGVGRLLIGKLLFLAENNTIKTSPLYKGSKEAFRRLGFVEDDGLWKLDPRSETPGTPYRWKLNEKEKRSEL